MIQEGLQESWPKQLPAALVPYQQGHLIARPPFFYATDLRAPIFSPGREIADELGEEEPGVEVVEVDPEHGPPYGIITSQTCEIVEERPQPLQPWIQVAPVDRCEPTSDLLKRDFVVRLKPPGLEGGAWFADLRLEMPLEKSILLDRTPIEAFPSEADYEAFGNQLAQRRGRPALDSVIHNVVLKTMGDMKTENKPQRGKVKRFRGSVYKLKLAIEGGTRLDPVAARLYVVTKGERSEEMTEWFAEWWDRAREVAEETKLDLLPTKWLSVEQLEIELEVYEGLIDLRSPL